MADKEEKIATARRSRGQYARLAEKAVQGLVDRVRALTGAAVLDVEELQAAEGLVVQGMVQDRLKNYSEAVIKCQVLEDLEEEDDEHSQRYERLDSGWVEVCANVCALRGNFKITSLPQFSSTLSNHSA